jgi:hypothetical protein
MQATNLTKVIFFKITNLIMFLIKHVIQLKADNYFKKIIRGNSSKQ